jgi:ribosomal protein L40E
MSIKQAILDFTDGETRNRIFVNPDIPIKKLSAARSQFIFRDEEVIVLYDDTVFGSAKDGIAITEEYIYAKQLWESPKSIKISTIKSISGQSKSLDNFEIYINNNHFITVSSSSKDDQPFLLGILLAAKDAVAKFKKITTTSTVIAELPARALARPVSVSKAQSQSAASGEALSCNECSIELPKGAKFCLECGSKVTPKGLCLECNAKLPENAKFCSECGTSTGKRSGANAPSVKPSGPQIDVDAVRREFAELLADSDKDVSIDSDGDLRVNFTTKKIPSFASGFRGCAMTYAIKVSTEGQTEEDDSRDARFSPADDGVWFGGPYVRVGRVPSAKYKAQIDASVWVTNNLEVHEVKLKAGKLDAPKLGSSRISLASLKATKDDSDGSYGVEYELKAYPNHYVHFEIVKEKPVDNADLWPSLDRDDIRSGNSWLYHVKPGDTFYVLFAEYEKVVEGITATLSGTAEPMEGAYDDVDENAETSTSVVEVSLRDIEGDEHIYWVEIDDLPSGVDELDWAIVKARVYHAEHVGTEPAEEDEDDLPVTAYEPFDRSDGEYTLIRSSEPSDYEDSGIGKNTIKLGHSAEASSVDGIDWHDVADRAFNLFFNAIRKGEDTDTAAEWFRNEIADQTEAAGIVYDYGWEQEITAAQLQLISETVATRLKGLNDEQGYQVSSEFYHGFIASLSNIIYNRSQVGYGDFDDLQKYWDQTIGNELPEECGTRLPELPIPAPDRQEESSVNSALRQLAVRTEISLTASGRLESYFSKCNNLYTSIVIEHGPGNLLKVSVVVEADGQADDLEEIEEAIGDYIFETFLTAGLIEIFGEAGYEELEFDNQFRVQTTEQDPLGSVREDIQSIEDKLYERGILVSATGDQEADVSISFGEWGEVGQRGFYWIIAITSNVSDKSGDGKWEELFEYVNEKLSDFEDEWPESVTSLVEDSFGTVVLLNGNRVY